MISTTGITNNYILQPALVEKHRKTLDWLSYSFLWKGELAFFQKVLSQRLYSTYSDIDKKKVDHFQNLILYYSTEAIEDIRKKLRMHESRLAKMLEAKSEWNVQYYKEHDETMQEAAVFSKQFSEFKKEFLEWAATLENKSS